LREKGEYSIIKKLVCKHGKKQKKICAGGYQPPKGIIRLVKIKNGVREKVVPTEPCHVRASCDQLDIEVD
jgi:hypothetical protein